MNTQIIAIANQKGGEVLAYLGCWVWLTLAIRN